MSHKTQLQTTNEKLASLVETLRGKALLPSAEELTIFEHEVEYRISGDSLRRIAQNIDENCQNSNYAYGNMTPAAMADAITSIYDQGYEQGYDDARSELPIPLILQANATPTIDPYYKSYKFNITDYTAELNGVAYKLWDFCDFEILESESNLVVAFYNTTNRPLTFYFYAYNYDEELQSDATTYKVVNVAPNSSTSATIESCGQEPIWEYELEGVVFY